MYFTVQDIFYVKMLWDGVGGGGETGTVIRISQKIRQTHKVLYIHRQSTMSPRRNWDSPALTQLLHTIPLFDIFLFLDPLTAVPLKVALFILFLVCSALS